MRIHGVIGQPLALIVPLNVSGAAPGAIEVQVEPAPGLGEAEEAAAETVRATYDPQHAVIRLTTPRRLVVPAIRLHLTVSGGSFVVEQVFDVLIDLPDFNRQFAPSDAAPATDEALAPVVAGAGIRLLTIPGPDRVAAVYGDAATRDVAGADPVPRPQATAVPAPGLAQRRPTTYAVRPGDTLSGIATRLAKTYAVPAAPLKLALYEANPQAFQPAQPDRAIAGKQLLVPDKLVVSSESPDRVAAFRNYLRRPQGGWRLPVFISFGEAAAEPPRGNGNGAIAEFIRAVGTVAAVAALLLLSAALGLQLRRRLRLRPLPFPGRDDRVAPAPADSGEEQEIKRLRAMLEERPWRSDIRFQLTQRLYKARDAAGFSEVAPALQAVLNEDAWLRVRAMGQELLGVGWEGRAIQAG